MKILLLACLWLTACTSLGSAPLAGQDVGTAGLAIRSTRTWATAATT